MDLTNASANVIAALIGKARKVRGKDRRGRLGDIQSL
jgi:hypothetical protein